MCKRLAFFLAIVISLFSCKPEKNDKIISEGGPQILNLPSTPFNYSELANPDVFSDPFTQAQDNEKDSNRVSNWGATLGRVLFYDKLLSKNNSISCASCHIQEFGFSDTARFSKGFEGGRTGRHSMTLINARYYGPGKFFWDERANTLEDQVLMPIQDEVEMGLTLDSLRARVASKSYYLQLFENAFGDPVVNSNRISKALAQFVRSIVAYNTRFHQEKGNLDPMKPFPGFTAQENLGKEIFYGSSNINCSGCHISNSFNTGSAMNNGVRNGDFGAYAHNQIEQQIGAFKAPSLVDIDKRPPYMHDGSLATLEEVIEHYNSGLNNDDGNLDVHLLDDEGKGKKMNLNQEEKDALLAFIKTLSDTKVRTEVAYSNPFVQ